MCPSLAQPLKARFQPGRTRLSWLKPGVSTYAYADDRARVRVRPGSSCLEAALVHLYFLPSSAHSGSLGAAQHWGRQLHGFNLQPHCHRWHGLPDVAGYSSCSLARCCTVPTADALTTASGPPECEGVPLEFSGHNGLRGSLGGRTKLRLKYRSKQVAEEESFKPKSDTLTN